MSQPTEWVRVTGEDFGTNGWSFSETNLLYIQEAAALHLAAGQTVKRIMLDVTVGLFIPTTATGSLASVAPSELQMAAAVNVVGTDNDHWPAALTEGTADPTVTGTRQLHMYTQAASWDGLGTLFTYALSEPIDSHGQRHVIAANGLAVVKSSVQIFDNASIMNSALGCSFAMNGYLRVLFEQATT